MLPPKQVADRDSALSDCSSNLFGAGHQAITYALRFFKKSCKLLGLRLCKSVIIRSKWFGSVSLVVISLSERFATVCRLSNDVDQSIVGHIVKRYIPEGSLKSSKIHELADRKIFILSCVTQHPNGQLRSIIRLLENGNVGVDLLSLRPACLVKSQAPAVPDRKRGHDGLCPSSPFALREAHGRQQPVAVVHRIGHHASPVSMPGIVGRGAPDAQ